MINCLVKSGIANTGAELIACFRVKSQLMVTCPDVIDALLQQVRQRFCYNGEVSDKLSVKAGQTEETTKFPSIHRYWP